jgi:hypothetical protein
MFENGFLNLYPKLLLYKIRVYDAFASAILYPGDKLSECRWVGLRPPCSGRGYSVNPSAFFGGVGFLMVPNILGFAPQFVQFQILISLPYYQSILGTQPSLSTPSHINRASLQTIALATFALHVAEYLEPRLF